MAESRALRALHVHSGNMFGGVESIMTTLARRPLDIEWHAALMYSGRLADELASAGIAVWRLPLARASRPWTVLASGRALRSLIATVRPDVAVVHSMWSLALLGRNLRATGIPLVLWAHGVVEGPQWQRWMARRTPPRFIICASNAICKETPRWFASAPRSAVVYAPVEPPLMHEPSHVVRSRYSTAEDSFVVLGLGRMEVAKGWHVLIEAIAAIPDRRVVAWLAGGTGLPQELAYARHLARLAADLGVTSRIRFLGELRSPGDVIGASDVVALPSLVPEGFAIAIVESLMIGRPVVTSRLGGAVEAVGTGGITVQPGDASDLASAIMRLAADPEETRRLALAGRAHALAICDVTSQARKVATALREAAREAPQPM